MTGASVRSIDEANGPISGGHRFSRELADEREPRGQSLPRSSRDPPIDSLAMRFQILMKVLFFGRRKSAITSERRQSRPGVSCARGSRRTLDMDVRGLVVVHVHEYL